MTVHVNSPKFKMPRLLKNPASAPQEALFAPLLLCFVASLYRLTLQWNFGLVDLGREDSQPEGSPKLRDGGSKCWNRRELASELRDAEI